MSALKQCEYNQESATNFLLEASLSGTNVPGGNPQPQTQQQNPYPQSNQGGGGAQ